MKTPRDTQKGSTILAVMLVMMVITLFGIASLKSSTSELQIASNARCYKQNIYRAEAAVMEAAQLMTNETDGEELKPEVKAWISDGTETGSDEFNPEEDPWQYTGSDANATYSILFKDNESGYAVVFEGLAHGTSLNMNSSTHMWQYGIYGTSQLCNGRAGVVAGYRKRY